VLVSSSEGHACGVCGPDVERAGTRWNAVLVKEANRPGLQGTPFVAVVYARGGSVESRSQAETISA